MKKLNRTYVMGIAFIVFAVWVAFQTALIPEKLVSNEPGPKLFPFISAIGMIIMAILSRILMEKKKKKRMSMAQLRILIKMDGSVSDGSCWSAFFSVWR